MAEKGGNKVVNERQGDDEEPPAVARTGLREAEEQHGAGAGKDDKENLPTEQAALAG